MGAVRDITFEQFKAMLAGKLGSNAEQAIASKQEEIKSVFDEAAKNDGGENEQLLERDYDGLEKVLDKVCNMFSSVISFKKGNGEDFDEIYYGTHEYQDISIDTNNIKWNKAEQQNLEQREGCSVAYNGDLKIYYNDNGSIDVYNQKDGQFAHFSKENVEARQKLGQEEKPDVGV